MFTVNRTLAILLLVCILLLLSLAISHNFLPVVRITYVSALARISSTIGSSTISNFSIHDCNNLLGIGATINSSRIISDYTQDYMSSSRLLSKAYTLFILSYSIMADEFAICDTCLGPDKNIKMIKQVNGEECKLCTRPFTVFRWHTSLTSATKTRKTIICNTCARVKNCCQSCMLDINYGISIDIRDTALKMAGLDKLILQGSDSSKNREVKAIMAEKHQAKFDKLDQQANEDDDKQQKARDLLMKLASKLKEKAPKVASSKNTKVKDTGEVSKLVKQLPFSNLISIPTSQPTLASFFIFGIGSDLPQYAISNYAKQFGGPVSSLTINHRAKCGFVTFSSRESAENFANHVIANKINTMNNNPGLIILENKFPVRITWGSPVNLGTDNDSHTNISLVVNKVMKQLADKDNSTEVKPTKSDSASKTNKLHNRKELQNRKDAKKPHKVVKPTYTDSATSGSKYKALSSDFEV